MPAASSTRASSRRWRETWPRRPPSRPPRPERLFDRAFRFFDRLLRFGLSFFETLRVLSCVFFDRVFGLRLTLLGAFLGLFGAFLQPLPRFLFGLFEAL